MKRILAIVLSAVMILAVLAACGNDSASPSGSGATATPAGNNNTAGDSTSSGGGERIEIVFSIWGDPAEQETTQKGLDVYNSMQDKVYVKALQIPNEEYADVLQTMATAGNMPDCGMVNEPTAIGWARQGLLMPIDIYEGQADKPLDYLAFKDGGKTVAYSGANEVLGLWYNRTMFDAAGVDYPPTSLDKAWTWDEFIEVAKQLTFDSNGNTPNDDGFDKNNIVQYGAYVNQWTWQLEVWALSNGGKWFSEDGKSIVFDDAAIEAMQKVVDLHLVHNVAPFNPGTTDSGFGDSVGAGNVAMCTEGQWATGFAGDTDIDYGVAVLPYMKRKANIVTGGPVGVFAGTKYPDEVADFVRWYTDEDNNFGTIEAGWWMPTKMNWYTDEALLKKWIDDVPLRARLPADAYRTAMKDVALDLTVSQSTGWYYTPNTFEIINRVLNPAMVEAINGSKTVAQVIADVRPAMEAALAG
ncbi:MAG: sugar ABC transporter substrate-binding protein [Oscillospiraceae bacterium]|nr:sugar ABC transporter substrate-binding protein [Oscillospiraceae bacterium]